MRGMTWLCFAIGILAFQLPAYSQSPPQASNVEPVRQQQEKQLEKAAEIDRRVRALSQEGKTTEALVLAKESLSIRKKVLGEEHPDTATSLNNIGFLLQAQGDYAAARPFLERALEIYRKVLGDEHSHIAASLNNIGLLLHRQGDYAAARPYYEQALEIRRNVLGQEHPLTAQSLRSLGVLLRAQGDCDAARPYHEQALEICQKVLGEEHRDTASSLNSLGSLLQAQGDYTAARPHLEQALEIRRKVLGEEHRDTATSFSDLGFLLLAQGDYAAARPYFEQALEIYKKVLGDEHPYTATSLNNLGGLLQTQGDYADARPYYEQALEIRRKVLGEEHPHTAQSLNNVGFLLDAQGDYDAARPYYEQAMEIRRKVLGEEHPEFAQSLNNLALLLKAQGNYTAARLYFEQALKIRTKVHGEEHPDTTRQLDNLGALLQAQGEWRHAVDVTDQSRRASASFLSRTLASLESQEQKRFLFSQSGKFHAALSLGYVNRSEAAAVQASASWLINGKGLSSEALAERQLLGRDSDNPKVKDAVEKLLKVRRKLATLTMTVPPPDQADARKASIAHLTQQEQTLNRQMAQVLGGTVKTAEWIELDAVRGALPPGTTFVNFARIPVFDFQAIQQEPIWQSARYIAWVIAKSGDVQLVDLGLADDIDQQINQIRGQLTDPNAADQLTEKLRQLTTLVWQPLAEKLPAETDDLILSPDGTLWLMPWNALPTGEDRFLIEDYGLQFVISGRERVQEKQAKSHRTPLLFADPTFDLTPERTRAAVEAIFRNETFDWDANRGLVSQTGLGKVSALPNTRAEAAAISPSLETISGKKPVSYLGKYALESVVKRVHRPQMLVLSTHGFFLPDQEVQPDDDQMMLAYGTRSSALLTAEGKPIENPLLRCGMLFAGCNQPAAGADDGVLTGMEIVGIDLRGTELVVLSACETGLGDIQTGEGVAGLRQAFQLAGAEAVVSTLWNVPDRDSAIIMNDFFENLADGQSKADALRTAQLKRIESRRQRYGSAHPFYWAAWTLTGN